MNEDARRALSNAIRACRTLLAGDRDGKKPGDLGEQLARHGFDLATRTPKPVAALLHLRPDERACADRLRAWHSQLAAEAPGDTDAERARTAFDQMRYELGYTAVHRICALRMAEARGVVVECIANGTASDGFRVYLQLAEDIALGSHAEAYRFFLERLYDELACSLPSVFDRRSASSILTPSPDAIEKLVAALNAPALENAWGAEETLGWIFEDWNDPDERKEMRKHAPRNARELAVRNQFFTPRWVVEFLTDNTLGRLWVDRYGSNSALVNECRFLAMNAASTGAPHPDANHGDPRDIRVLDPACGSGHFLLYAFELLEVIYMEAWTRRTDRSADRTPIWDEFADETAFRREIPRLIIENNLHGVDIDSRCIQEAALALWLRAQRAWNDLKVPARERPTVRTGHLVSAQALPNSPEMRAKLLGAIKPAILARLAEQLFVRVGEMGVLLRVEDLLAKTIDEVKREYARWKQEERQREGFLLKNEARPPSQVSLEEFRELRELDDASFWKEAEERVEKTLEKLHADATENEHVGSRLFAEGVRHGFEYLDVARLQFDVVLMNPPFGEPTESTKDALDAAYPDAGHDLYGMFYQRALEMLRVGGRVGAITSRSWLALPTLEAFRVNVVASLAHVELAADLGYGVLNAKVETAAAVLAKGRDDRKPGTWVRLVKTSRKEETLLEALRSPGGHRARFDVPLSRFETLPSNVLGYWMSESLVRAFARGRTVESVADVKQGTATADDFRFLRLAWEVPASSIGLAKDWARFAKGGEYRPFYDDVHLVVRWTAGGAEIIAWGRGRPQNIEYFGRRGVTWPRRTNLRPSMRVLPEGCAFGDKGPAAIPVAPTSPGVLLGVLNSNPAYLLLSLRLQNADDSADAISKSYEVGLVGDLPWPGLSAEAASHVSDIAVSTANIVRVSQLSDDDTAETCSAFAIPEALVNRAELESLRTATERRVRQREDRLAQIAAGQAEIDQIVAGAYGFSDVDRTVMNEELEPPLERLPGTSSIDGDVFRTAYLTKAALDGALLPGGRDAEQDVRVEHRRGRRMHLRDEAQICRLFDAAPRIIADARRSFGLLREEDVARSATDILSYAIGVAFGRWDVRLATHPEWIPRFVDPFDPLPACPLGQLVNAEGLPATADRIASEPWLAARTDASRLPDPASLDGTPAETTAADYPIAVAWDGLLIDDVLDDDASHRPASTFLARIGTALDYVLGEARAGLETEILAALHVDSLAAWYRAPNSFFDDHYSRYSKSRRNAPIYWPLSTEKGGLTFWMYAPRFSLETIAAIVNYLHQSVHSLREQIERAGDNAPARWTAEASERQRLLDALRELTAKNYRPHHDDGFVVTAAPLAFAFRHAGWRAKLSETWAGFETGACDWAHLAMAMRPNEVTAKCATDRSLAIAHGLVAAVPPSSVTKRRAKKKTASDEQLTLGGTRK